MASWPGPRCFTTTPPRSWRSSSGRASRSTPDASGEVAHRDRTSSVRGVTSGAHGLVNDGGNCAGEICPKPRRKWRTGDEVAPRRAVWKVEGDKEGSVERRPTPAAV